ncbi:lysoplasmalogenase family protein [Antarcticimicrobium sediminis]|uniref:Lysoplasmalogenase n=1 Tax=Antarcticimicrobium sediminis TaxID=2546227 RepID=A0A4R5EYH5_9RHOB|nr:lysoplasmalogenase family protein [Antarcticimicrobium sediminis]TDE40155.1 lysoplasmalogenase [Antarcticimicrobium sediminis]
MTAFAFALTACTLFAALFCALVYLPLVVQPPSALRSADKTAAVVLLAAAAALMQTPALLILALALCALGDWCLSRPGERAFRAGIGAFAAGHLAYIALFLTRAAADPGQVASGWRLAALLTLALLGAILAARLAPRAGALRLPVLIYIPIILGMGACALTLPPTGALALVLPAALAFIASDLVLASQIFLLPKDHPLLAVAPYTVWPLYWGAQAGFLAAFALPIALPAT